MRLNLDGLLLAIGETFRDFEISLIKPDIELIIPYWRVIMLKLLGIKSSRGTRISVNILILSAIWWYCYNLELGAAYSFMISAVPYWALVAFGSFALWKIGLGLYTLRDCVSDSEELDLEIKQAKEFLKSKGFKSN